MGDSYYEYFLAHHGIKGQKWGDRNGPPYPLDPEDHSTSEKKAVSKSSKKNYTEGENKKQKGLSDGQKKAIAIGTAAVAAGLVVYGGYKLTKNPEAISKLVLSGKNAFGAGNQTKTVGLSRTFKDVNPGRVSDPTNIVFNMNCGNCAIASELRSRGMDFRAMGNPLGMTKAQLGSYFKMSDGAAIEPFIDVSDNIFDFGFDATKRRTRGASVKKQVSDAIVKSVGNEDARGALFIPMELGSHWISWEKSSSGVKFFDTQTGSDVTKFFESYIYRKNDINCSLTAFRLDNAELNMSTIFNAVERTSSSTPSVMSGVGELVGSNNGFLLDLLTMRK